MRGLRTRAASRVDYNSHEALGRAGASEAQAPTLGFHWLGKP